MESWVLSSGKFCGGGGFKILVKEDASEFVWYPLKDPKYQMSTKYFWFITVLYFKYYYESVPHFDITFTSLYD